MNPSREQLEALMAETIFARITRQIVESIEAGAGEAKMPWHTSHSAVICPRNGITGRSYRGINVVTLWVGAHARQYAHGDWATYRQWSAAGAQVRKGERGYPVVFWEPLPAAREASGASDAPRFVARAYTVFNLAQVDGYEPEPQPRLPEDQRLAEAERAFTAVGATIVQGGDVASYSPVTDQICMPEFSCFRDAASYYSVLAHELTHWTGAKHRLDRDLSGRFGSSAYALEELVAELGAAFACARLGIAAAPRPDHAAYIASWLRVLRADARAIFTVAGKAQESVEYLFPLAPLR
jgi:antirestriction protein ArdC